MELKIIEHDFSICKVPDLSAVHLDKAYYFLSKTDEELSLVCLSEDIPANATDRDAGWRGFRIQGILDFSLVGILAKLSAVLADNNIGIFAVSTFNTDYIFTKADHFAAALSALAAAGYRIAD